MKTAKSVLLNGRDFGSDVLVVAELEEWLRVNHVPSKLDALLGGPFELVQVEFFLCALEAARFNDFFGEEADTQLRTGEGATRLKATFSGVPDLDPSALSHWFVGASAHLAMRQRLRGAIDRDELVALDGVTLEPRQRVAPEGAAAIDKAPEAALKRKRDAFISEYSLRWPTIAADLRSGHENGLSAAAKAPGEKGMWLVECAIEWARQRGKLVDPADENAPRSSMFSWPGRVHRTR